MKIVSDSEYNLAWSNQEYQKIMTAALDPFRKTLSALEYEEVRYNALWEALRRYNDTKKIKFTSYLHRMVRWNCGRIIQSKRRNTLQTNVELEKYYTCNLDGPSFYEIVDGLSEEEQQILRERFVDNMTLKEIGEIHGVSYETVRNILSRLYKSMA